MKYGKLIDGKMEFYDWRTIFVIDGVNVASNNPEVIISQGYKELIYNSPTPEEGYYASSYDWTETDTQLIQTWNYVKYIEPEIEKSELEIQVEEMSSTIDMLTECILEMSAMIYA